MKKAFLFKKWKRSQFIEILNFDKNPFFIVIFHIIIILMIENAIYFALGMNDSS